MTVDMSRTFPAKEKNRRMRPGKNSKHIKNRFSLITDKVAQGDLEIQHKGTAKMWADVNIKPTQGKIFRIMRGKVMGGPAEYDNAVERKGTLPLLMPKMGSARISMADGKTIEKVAAVAPVKLPMKTSKKRTL